MPRFKDGCINLQERVRRVVEDVANGMTAAEAEHMCSGGANSRNGYRERALKTRVGDITMRIPKLRSGSFFPEDVIERYQRVGRALASPVAEMYATGTSARKVQKIAEKMGVSRLSKDQVSALCESLDADVNELCARPLGDAPVPYIWLDATHAKCRRAADMLEEAEPDALAHLDLPPSYCKRLRTNNVQERTNREIKRRSRVVQVFPSEASLIRLAGAVMCEQNEAWQGPGYFSEARMREPCDEGEAARRAGAAGPGAAGG